MKKSELDNLILKNIKQADQELLDINFLQDAIRTNNETLGLDNPDNLSNAHKSHVLKIMQLAMSQTLIDLGVVEVDQ
ncbi:hypothetical protein AB6831_04345 [Carnobacterium divergens]|uniref:hypothetical protein n=1 Tax=Carnobacterium divergens TaxID=2748 RepID=UPI0039C9426E